MAEYGPDSEPSTHEYRSAATGRVPLPPRPQETAGLSPTTVPDTTAGPRPNLPTFGDYELLHIAGEGGMGVVYQARHRPSGRLVALKTMKADALLCDDLVERFRREIRTADAARHPHIVPVGDVGEIDGQLYYTMPYVPDNLRRNRSRFADPRAAAALIAAVARAVHHAHQAGVIHRDLKPGNVLLTLDGTPMIADFGLARWSDASAMLTRTDELMGTPHYMAPEQTGGPADLLGPASDVWALGVMLYELVAGQRPFDAATRESTLSLVRTADPPPPRQFQPALDATLESIILTCLRKLPSERYATAAALADDLNRWLAGAPVRARPAPVPPQASHSRGYRGLIAAALLLAVPGLLLFAAGGTGPDRSRKIAAVAPGVGVPDEAALRQQLSDAERGRPVTLVPRRGGPTWYRLMLGSADIASLTCPPPAGIVRVAAGGEEAVYELMSESKRASYRLEAWIRHAEAHDDRSLVGVCFGCRDRPLPGQSGRLFDYCMVGFNDRVADTILRAKEAEPRNRIYVHRVAQANLAPITVGYVRLQGGDYRFVPDASDPKPSRFRRLKIEVRPKTIDIWLDDLYAGRADVADMNLKARLSPGNQKTLPVPVPNFDPLGSLGLYVAGSAALFHSVTWSPLPEEK
jgi:hypothetical protein